ncbi:hypothetical protein VKT23_017948 [Stygiomarasmius scandens]
MKYLSLNRVELLFVPPQKQFGITEPHAVQVLVHSSGFRNSEEGARREASVKDIATYYHAQPDVTAAIENLVVSYLSQACAFPKKLVLEGEFYVLRGERLKSQTVNDYVFRHGGSDISISKDKWVFEFVPKEVLML